MKEKENILLRLLGFVLKILIWTLLFLFVIRMGRVAYGYGYKMFAQEPLARPGLGRSVVITIEQGDSVGDIAKLLEDKGLIEDKWLFRLQERISMHHGEISPGTYTLSTEMTPEEMISVMAGTETELPENAAALEGDAVSDDTDEWEGTEELPPEQGEPPAEGGDNPEAETP